MKAQVGKYFFGRLRSSFGIWQYTSETSSTFIKGIATYEDAVREVYALNGWGEPKSIRKSY